MTLADQAAEAKTTKRPGDFWLRLVSSLVLAALALAGTWIGGWPATFVVGAVAVVVMVEWRSVTRPHGRPIVTAGCILLIAISLVAVEVDYEALWLVALVAGAAVAIAVLEPWTAVGILYTGLFAGCLLALRQDDGFGLAAVVFLLATVWATDSFAYLAGRRIGGPKLWPRISPNKTWSGFVCGLAGGVVAGLIVIVLWRLPITVPLVLVAIALSLSAHAGDLFESAVKRRFGVKDASHLIPGHGGMMDRIDGLIFASVVAALIGFLHAGPDRVGQGLVQW